jgi:hypothetical protein
MLRTEDALGSAVANDHEILGLATAQRCTRRGAHATTPSDAAGASPGEIDIPSYAILFASLAVSLAPSPESARRE